MSLDAIQLLRRMIEGKLHTAREIKEMLALLYGANSWEADNFRWRGSILEGQCAHWCLDWDELPVDETCPEWPCACADDLIQQAGDENRA